MEPDGENNIPATMCSSGQCGSHVAQPTSPPIVKEKCFIGSRNPSTTPEIPLKGFSPSTNHVSIRKPATDLVSPPPGTLCITFFQTTALVTNDEGSALRRFWEKPDDLKDLMRCRSKLSSTVLMIRWYGKSKFNVTTCYSSVRLPTHGVKIKAVFMETRFKGSLSRRTGSIDFSMSLGRV